jgi:aspartate aminotransferase
MVTRSSLLLLIPMTDTAPLSPTLAINEEVSRRRAAGLATVPLGFGEAGIPVLPEISEQLALASGKAPYGPVAGVPELRSAAAGYWDRRGLPTDPDLVIAGPGSKSLLFALLHAAGGSVALPSPSWVSYAAQAALIGRRVHLIPTRRGEGGLPDAELLGHAAKRARAAGEPISAVIVTLPDNPTGTLAAPASVRALCEVSDGHDILVISDEIYRDLVHDPATSMLSPAEVIPSVVVTSGLSKNLALGGWRIGVARMPDSVLGRRIRDRALVVASEVWSAPSHPVQMAAAWALAEPWAVSERIALSRRLHSAVARAVSAVLSAAGVPHAAPQAAFYMYPEFDLHRSHLAARWSIRSGADLAQVLLAELGVATLPASAFGQAEDVLSLRVATSLLYGSDDEQRLTALHHDNPGSLPWIAEQIDTFARALHKLLAP